MGMSPWPATLLSKETLKELRHRRKGKPLEILKHYKYIYVKRLLLSFVLWGAYDGEDKKNIGNMPCSLHAQRQPVANKSLEIQSTDIWSNELNLLASTREQYAFYGCALLF